MRILILTTDLVVVSQASGVAAKLGAKLRAIATPEKVIDDLTNAADEIVDGMSDEVVVLLDLSMAGFDPRQWVPRLRASANPPRGIVAYSPHVHQERLAAAAEAGCDEVLTRGQLHAKLDAVLERYLRSP